MFTVRINNGKKGHEVFQCERYKIERSEDSALITVHYKFGDVWQERVLGLGENAFFMNDTGYTVDVVKRKSE